MRNLILIGVILSLLSQLAPPARADAGGLSKGAANKIAGAFGLPSPFGSHTNIEPFQIDGKLVYILEIRDEKGSRCTNNFSARFEGQRRFSVHVCEVSAESRMRMSFQRKGDKRFEDSNRGRQFRHGDLIVIDGSKNYLAQRNFDASDLKAKHPDAFVALLEDGLTMERVKQYFENGN